MSAFDAVAIETILALEEQLDQAMRASDVQALGELLADDLVYTGNHGQLVTRQEDLALHRSGNLVFEQVQASGRVVRPLAGAAVVALRLHLAGRQGGRRFEGAFRFTRVWACHTGRWQLIAAQATRAAPEAGQDESTELSPRE